MTASAKEVLTKVPAITLGFWIIKILATTLGETGGDAVSMSMNLGYLIGTGIFMVIFVGAVLLQIRAKNFSVDDRKRAFVIASTLGFRTFPGRQLRCCLQ